MAGIHSMAIEWEHKVPEILEAAGLDKRPRSRSESERNRRYARPELIVPRERIEMPKKYHIHVNPTPNRYPVVGRSGIVDWGEGCLKCAKCVKQQCVYGVYKSAFLLSGHTCATPSMNSARAASAAFRAAPSA